MDATFDSRVRTAIAYQPGPTAAEDPPRAIEPTAFIDLSYPIESGGAACSHNR